MACLFVLFLLAELLNLSKSSIFSFMVSAFFYLFMKSFHTPKSWMTLQFGIAFPKQNCLGQEHVTRLVFMTLQAGPHEAFISDFGMALSSPGTTPSIVGGWVSFPQVQETCLWVMRLTEAPRETMKCKDVKCVFRITRVTIYRMSHIMLDMHSVYNPQNNPSKQILFYPFHRWGT